MTACLSGAAQYPEWRHSGSLFILTTPEGANLPPSAAEKDFPLLVRLHRDYFDFAQARPDGADYRFSMEGKPLAYQIEEWNAAEGAASVWVRVPLIRGNARQEIKLHWGRSDATAESSGAAVFNASNGYLSVWHMSEPVKDEVGALQTTDAGTKAARGIIGPARRLDGGQGLFGGERIGHFPVGGQPHSSEAWFRPEKPNGRVLGWGNEQAQGKVVMNFRSPPHVSMDCYFSDGNVTGSSRIQMSEWVHVAHVYEQGTARLYVNGVLDGLAKGRGAPLNIRTPARLWIGGWYHHYDFVGEIDEARISKVARSADWYRLQFENQKAMQTLAGLVVQPGDDFEVSLSQATVEEGRRALLRARAGGAQKVFWILRRKGAEEILAVDRFSFTFEAGRVTGDQSASLVFRAVYPDGVRNKEISLAVKEAIPEPVFRLKAPAAWNGREPIEVIPEISNLPAMREKGAEGLRYGWRLSGLAVHKEVAPGKLILKRAQNSGPLQVALALGNGGAETVQTTTILVREPARDEWVPRTPSESEMPENNQFVGRDDGGEGALFCNGVLPRPADAVFLRVYAGERLVSDEKQTPLADGRYSMSARLKAGLVRYRIEFGSVAGGRETLLHTATNLVCGDAYLIQGQSNALATDTSEEALAFASDWIRSYGCTAGHPEGARWKGWGNAVWRDRAAERLQLGYWGMELAKRLVESRRLPICILNGAVGGTRIDQHQRNPVNPEDVSTIYGRLLWRVRQARLAHGIRGVLWHQGENDQGADGPTGGFGWETYQQYFVEMAAAWKEDYPNLQRLYVFQIWPMACSMGVNGSDNMLREVQRTLPALFSNMSVMSTLGVKPPGGCHYPLAGWAELGRCIQPLIERDIYGQAFSGSIAPPNLVRAAYVGDRQDQLALEFDQPVVWNDSLASEFLLDGVRGGVAGGCASGNSLRLALAAPSNAQRITYLDSRSWSPARILYGANGLAALTFCDVPIRAR